MCASVKLYFQCNKLQMWTSQKRIVRLIYSRRELCDQTTEEVKKWGQIPVSNSGSIYHEETEWRINSGEWNNWEYRSYSSEQGGAPGNRKIGLGRWRRCHLWGCGWFSLEARLPPPWYATASVEMQRDGVVHCHSWRFRSTGSHIFKVWECQRSMAHPRLPAHNARHPSNLPQCWQPSAGTTAQSRKTLVNFQNHTWQNNKTGRDN